MPQPISPARLAPFWKAFRQYVSRNTHADYPYIGQRYMPKIGLCVSGGPDSMALAYLLSNHIKDKPDADGLHRIHAIIVDHNAREDSADEAIKVSNWLTGMGIQSTIEKMDWPADHPAMMTDFESEARIRRYRHLGAVARDRRIFHLFTGHHQDDQIETIMMRMIRGNNPTVLGLLGMQTHCPLPESESYRGIRNKEPDVPLSSIMRDPAPEGPEIPPYKYALRESRLGQVLYTNYDNIRGLHHGGVKLHRPLLNFEKDDLIATCEANNIPYIRDKSNDDPTFTKRNAIRKLRTNKLPRALQTGPLLQLAEKANQVKAEIDERAERYLELISILTFDFRSGVAEIRIPRSFLDLYTKDPAVAARVLAKLASLVSPTSADRRQTLAADNVVLDFCMLMRSIYGRKSRQGLPASNYMHDRVIFRPVAYADESCTVWRLSRAPMSGSEVDDNTRSFDLRVYTNDDERSIEVDLDHISDPYGDASEATVEEHGLLPSQFLYTRWLLWDYRFWIRVRLPYIDMLPFVHIRPYHATDIADLKLRMDEAHFEDLQVKIRRCATGNIRHTLPVLTFANEIIAFPTVFKSMVNLAGLHEKAQELNFGRSPQFRWDVAYKLLPDKISSWGSQVTTSYSKISDRDTLLKLGLV